MLFSTSKPGHSARLFRRAFWGRSVYQPAPAYSDEIEPYGRHVIQALVAIVTIWATVRKALQKPETVVKVPAVGVVAYPQRRNAGTDGAE